MIRGNIDIFFKQGKTAVLFLSIFVDFEHIRNIEIAQRIKTVVTVDSSKTGI